MHLRYKHYKYKNYKPPKKKTPQVYYKIENGLRIMVIPIMGTPLSTSDIGPTPRRYKNAK